MIFLFGERVRSRSAPVGQRHCAVCRSGQAFSETSESLWFSLFGIPLLPIEQVASYWRCEKCHTAYRKGETDLPSAVPVVRKVTMYILLGYNQQEHAALAGEICHKLTGFEFTGEDLNRERQEIAAGKVDMLEQLRSHAPETNDIGKRQIIEAAFLAAYASCDMQFEDRVRINLMGNALGVDLTFVNHAIGHCRKQNYYGIRRLGSVESRPV